MKLTLECTSVTVLQRAIHRSLLLLNENVLPSHPHAPAGVNLQSNHAIREFGRCVSKVHDLHAIELRHHVIALYGHFKLIPLVEFQRLLALRRRHLHPAASSAFIQSAGVLAHVWVHLDLHALDVRPMFGIDARNARMEKHAAIARRFALEFQAQAEITIRLLSRQVAILVGRTFAQDRTLLHDPLLLPIILPAGQILPVEKRHPSILWWRFRYNSSAEDYRCGEEGAHSAHSKTSISACREIGVSGQRKLITIPA